MRIGVLGPLFVSLQDEDIPLTRPSQRRLLEILVLASGRPLRFELLIDRFWAGEPPATARAAIHTHVSAVRKLLGTEVISTDGDSYRLVVSDLDVIEFRDHAVAARDAESRREWGAVLRHAEAALALWRGTPFVELLDDDFSQPVVAGLDETRLELMDLRAAALLALDRAGDVVADLERLVVEYPLRERYWEHLMTARFRLGRHAEALRAYREVAEHLAETGLEPGEGLRRLEERILLDEESSRQTPHNLPVELDDFVGRKSDVAGARALLETQRLVTITGAGGAGKTRLAARLARSVLDGYPEGVWLVELAPLRDAGRVPAEVALAMGLQPRGEDILEAVSAATAAARTLIVLDNCEHLSDGVVHTILQLLRASPDLKILATSREPLRIPGETIHELQGMRLPEPGTQDAGVAMESEAVELFAVRAKQASQAFDLDEETTPAVVEICRQLDGLPLAIELAAARTRSLSVGAIAERLGNHLKLLTRGSRAKPVRHRTLEATIEWSYRLLDPPQRATLNRLSVFRGGFDLEAAEQVVSGAGIEPADITPYVADLVEKSLVTTYSSPVGERYRLLETVRQFAEARFRETTHATTIYGRHLAWCLGLVQNLWPGAIGGEREAIGAILATNAENLLAALEWATARDQPHEAVALSHALGWHWYVNGHLSAAIDVLDTGLEHSSDAAEIALGSALLSRCHAYSESFPPAMRLARDAYERLPSLSAPIEKIWVIAGLHLIHLMSMEADPAAMLPLAAQAHDVATESSDPHVEIVAEQLLADARCWNGDTREGLAHQHRALELARATGDPTVINDTYGASIYNFMLDPDARRDEPMRIALEWESQGTLGPETWKSTATDWLPWIHLQTGDFDTAAEAIARIGERTPEGYNRSIHLIARASLLWMRGDLERAVSDVDEVEGRGVSARWTHTFYPLAAEIAADLGDLARVRRLAETYLDMPVHPSREAPKLGVLYPLVRAELGEALGDGGGERARRTVAEMRRILEETPPVARAWTSILTHSQNLAMAEAEVSRIEAPNPETWAELADGADYAYYRIYARWRLGEALLDAGRADEALEVLQQAHETADASGMALMASRIKATSNGSQSR